MMLRSLEDFSQKITDKIETFRQHGDNPVADIISSSSIACLAQLAVLYEIVGRTDPFAKAEMDRFCDSALQRLGALSSDLHIEEYTYLDLLLGVRNFCDVY